MGLLNIGKNLLKLVPGVGQVVSLIDTVGDIAEAVGGDTGKKIKTGLSMVSDGLNEAGAQPLTPEQRTQLELAGQRHKERMAEIELSDIEGGRGLAKAELASQDEYVRQTRPKLLRIYAWGFLLLCFIAVPLVVAAAVWGNLSASSADTITYVVCWLIGTIGTTFAAMYRTYTGQRTAEKMAEVGMQPEGLMDKLAKLRRGGR